MKNVSTLFRGLLFLMVGLLFFASCTSTKTVTVDADYIGKSGFIMAKPIVAEITVERRKIEGKAIIKNSLYGAEVAAKAARNLAVIDAIKKGDADIIVQPMYEIESTQDYTTATVSGFAGKYKVFRDLTDADTTAFAIRARMDNSSLITDFAAPAELNVAQAKPKTGLILGISLGAALLLSLVLGIL